jgi:hypothetical protein
MRGTQTRGLAIGLMAAGLSVLGVGTSSAGSAVPADQGGDTNPIAQVACMVQHAAGQHQGDCGSMPQDRPGDGGGGGGGESPISQLACMLQNAGNPEECQQQPS